jgi:D-alanyl-lipoteichoic acid acyltransferase DltB (MBOAT superfamily)
MLFPTIEFAIFFSIVFPVTWAVNRRNTLKKHFLLLASYFFYGFWSTNYLLILLLSPIFNFYLGKALGYLKQRNHRLVLLWFGIAINLAILIYFKYYNFLLSSLMNWLLSAGIQMNAEFIEVAVPVAISFLTFHVLAYIIDIYHRRIDPARSLLDIMLYVSFFPHLIAGPIIRPKSFLDQTARISDPAEVNAGPSIFLILAGLFKKILIANYIATDFVDPIFHAPQDRSSLDLLLGMYGYALQIYCDFSGYTDIAIGLANLLGYRFPENFNQPYRALTFQDFWRRWHITLSSWLRDYLYIPMGGNRHGVFRTYMNILVTMGLGGLWHGAKSTFLLWGLMHGAALVGERMLGITGHESQKRGRLSKTVSWVVTFHMICLSWVFFRAPSFDIAADYIVALVSNYSIETTISPLVAIMLVLGALTQALPKRPFERLQVQYDSAPVPIKIAIASGVMFVICVAAPPGVPPFIYFQF